MNAFFELHYKVTFFNYCYQFGRGVKLTTLLNLIVRLRMSGTILPFPHMSSRRGA